MKKLGEIAAAALEKPPVNEIFLVQLDRQELELLLAHVSTLYVVELSREQTPNAMCLLPTGEALPLPDLLAQLGAKAIARAARIFLGSQGIEGCRVLSNKFFRLLGRPEL